VRAAAALQAEVPAQGCRAWLGLYARACAGFFAQFGRVTKVRVSRNKKTGAAKHYAFLEFASAEVAAIAAEAMDGYMLFTQARRAPRHLFSACLLSEIGPPSCCRPSVAALLWPPLCRLPGRAE